MIRIKNERTTFKLLSIENLIRTLKFLWYWQESFFYHNQKQKQIDLFKKIKAFIRVKRKHFFKGSNFSHTLAVLQTFSFLKILYKLFCWFHRQQQHQQQQKSNPFRLPRFFSPFFRSILLLTPPLIHIFPSHQCYNCFSIKAQICIKIPTKAARPPRFNINKLPSLSLLIVPIYYANLKFFVNILKNAGDEKKFRRYLRLPEYKTIYGEIRRIITVTWTSWKCHKDYYRTGNRHHIESELFTMKCEMRVLLRTSYCSSEAFTCTVGIKWRLKKVRGVDRSGNERRRKAFMVIQLRQQNAWS